MQALLVSLLLLTVAAGQTPPAAPQPPEETVKPEDRCSVEGAVLNLQTGEPLKKAHVKLSPAERSNSTSWGAITDAAGHFLVEDVNPGKYRFSADRTALSRRSMGRRGPANRERKSRFRKGKSSRTSCSG